MPVKGFAAEAFLRFPLQSGWSVAEYVPDCHRFVECYCRMKFSLPRSISAAISLCWKEKEK